MRKKRRFPAKIEGRQKADSLAVAAVSRARGGRFSYRGCGRPSRLKIPDWYKICGKCDFSFGPVDTNLLDALSKRNKLLEASTLRHFSQDS